MNDLDTVALGGGGNTPSSDPQVIEHSDLPKCPMCGGDDIRSGKDQYGWFAICYTGDMSDTGCGLRTDHYLSRDNAIAAWTKRV